MHMEAKEVGNPINGQLGAWCWCSSMGFSSKSTGVGCQFLLQGIFPN